MKSIKVAMVQMDSKKDDLIYNEDLIKSFVLKAVKENVKIICFPELCLVGYGFDDMDQRIDCQNEIISRLKVLSLKKDITIIVGGFEKVKESYYISQFVIDEKVISYRKIHIGNREREYVSAGQNIEVFYTKDIKIGIMLCYDGHFPDLATIMAKQGASIIFNPSASPSESKRRISMWQKYLPARAYDNRIFVAATNLCFDDKGGGIIVYDCNGDLVSKKEADEDKLVVFEYTSKVYAMNSMKNRDFKVDRREDIYKKYLK